MKTKEEVHVSGKPTFYAVLYNPMRQAALDLGYALAIHGSMQSDMDLIAVAWTKDAKPPTDLVIALNECLGRTVWKEFGILELIPEIKPHNRIAYELHIMGDWRIDLSIIPPIKDDNDIYVFEELKAKI